jgi:hypothetical protein
MRIVDFLGCPGLRLRGLGEHDRLLVSKQEKSQCVALSVLVLFEHGQDLGLPLG